MVGEYGLRSFALGFNATLNSEGHIMAVGDAHVFSGFLKPVLSFPKPPNTFLTCFSRGKTRKYTRKKVRLNRVLNSQPPGAICEQKIKDTENVDKDHMVLMLTYPRLNFQPRPGGSVVSVSDLWPGGCELETRLSRNFFPAYFRLSPLPKHVRKVADGFGKKFVLVLVWESQETHELHRPPWYNLSCESGLNLDTTNQNFHHVIVYSILVVYERKRVIIYNNYGTGAY